MSHRAIVTGGSRGIGFAIARAILRSGGRVMITGRDDKRLHDAVQSLAKLVRDPTRVAGTVVDVRDRAGIERLIDDTARRFGGLDTLVNNAGVGVFTEVAKMTDDEWEDVIETNLTGVFYGIKHAARAMKAAGRGGVIVNMASILGVVGFSGAPAYTAAKHGILGLTKAAALELAPDGIRVVAVCPAFIRTPLITGQEEAVLPRHPIGRLGESEEIAALTAFLASDEAAFITGTYHLADGGYTAQ